MGTVLTPAGFFNTQIKFETFQTSRYPKNDLGRRKEMLTVRLAF
jgi:hypothetical protein